MSRHTEEAALPTTSGCRVAVWGRAAWAGDALFDRFHSVNRDNHLSGWHQFDDAVRADGGECHTHDWYVERNATPDIVIFFDVPRLSATWLTRRWPGARRWVILYENVALVRRNFALRRHREFERIFTWHDGLVDGVRYFKLDLANPLPDRVLRRELDRPHFMALIAGNKKAHHPDELYSSRIRLIEWYERQAPGDLHVYGAGWNNYTFGGPAVFRAFNMIGPVRRRVPHPTYAAWKGLVDTKLDTFADYRFAFCIENTDNVPGYITEKLFDGMIAGCVPIYRGAPNITDHVPAECFVDMRRFASPAELHEFLTGMDDETREAYVEAADRFLGSPAVEPFTDRCYARILAAHVASVAADR